VKLLRWKLSGQFETRRPPTRLANQPPPDTDADVGLAIINIAVNMNTLGIGEDDPGSKSQLKGRRRLAISITAVHVEPHK